MKTVKEAAQWLLDRDHFLILTHNNKGQILAIRKTNLPRCILHINQIDHFFGYSKDQGIGFKRHNLKCRVIHRKIHNCKITHTNTAWVIFLALFF